MDGYRGEHTHRLSRGGGVSVFCSEVYGMERIDEMSYCNEILEVCSVKLKIHSNIIIVIGIYRPPASSIENFLEILESLLRSPSLRNKFVFLMGDMNINLTDISSLPVNNYISCLNSFNFIPVITKPTRFAPNDPNQNPSTLDHIILNKPISFKSGVLEWDHTDHCPTFIYFNILNNSSQNLLHKIVFRPFSDDNLSSMVSEVEKIDWDGLFRDENVHICVERFAEILNKIYCLSFPKKQNSYLKKDLQSHG